MDLTYSKQHKVSPLSEAIYKIYGERLEGDSQNPTPVVATIFAPERTDDGLDYCRVRIAGVFDDDKRIPGVDAEQARELGAIFARDIFERFGISITSEENCEAEVT